MRAKFIQFKTSAIKLRKAGKTYGEIVRALGENIPKSTLSTWFKKIYLNISEKKIIDEKIIESSKRGMEVARIINKEKREKYLQSIIIRNKHLPKIFNNIDVKKIALSMLYRGEGTKGLDRGSLRFGNSDPFVIDLFLNLIKKCYTIDEKKFRCTVLCRADQNTKELEKFWAKITKIPKTQFYKTRIDARTIGKPTKKSDYKGVCVIDYFSADIFLDLMQIPKTIYKMGL